MQQATKHTPQRVQLLVSRRQVVLSRPLQTLPELVHFSPSVKKKLFLVLEFHGSPQSKLATM